MLDRFRIYARKHGILGALAEIPRRLVARVYSVTKITILIKDLQGSVAAKEPDRLKVVPLDRDSLPGLSELNRKRGRPRVDTRFRDSVERGMKGYLALIDGEVIGYYWYIESENAAAHPDLDWLGTAIPMRPGDVYSSDFFILPESRGRGIANEVLSGIENDLRRLGFNRILGYVEEGNLPARWLYSSRGYVSIGDVYVRRTLFRRKVSSSEDER